MSEGNNKPITHETFVVGYNNENRVVFFKSYIYNIQKEEAQNDLKWVIDNLHHWEIGAASEWCLVHEDNVFEINIPHP